MLSNHIFSHKINVVMKTVNIYFLIYSPLCPKKSTESILHQKARRKNTDKGISVGVDRRKRSLQRQKKIHVSHHEGCIMAMAESQS